MQHLSTIVAVALAGSLYAQVNPFVFYPQDPERQTVTCTSFVGRPDWNRAAEALWEYNDEHIRGLGGGLAGHGVRRIFGIYHWVADEKLSTVETYDLVIRGGLAAGGPDMSVLGEKFRLAGLTTPPSSSQSRGTWIMYDGFNLTQQGGWNETPDYPLLYIGIGLPANPLWPATDGHSLFRADMLNANTGATVGENHHLGAVPPTWAGLTNAASFRTPWSYILGPFVTTPNLHVGGIDPTSNRLGASGANFGLGGLYPDLTAPRSDGLTLRVTDNLYPFAFVFYGAALGFAQVPYYEWGYSGVPGQNPTLIGWSHLGDPSMAISLGFAQLQNGVRERPIAAPGTIPPALLGTTLAFQAVVWDLNTMVGDWTDAQATHF